VVSVSNIRNMYSKNSRIIRAFQQVSKLLFRLIFSGLIKKTFPQNLINYQQHILKTSTQTNRQILIIYRTPISTVDYDIFV